MCINDISYLGHVPLEAKVNLAPTLRIQLKGIVHCGCVDDWLFEGANIEYEHLLHVLTLSLVDKP